LSIEAGLLTPAQSPSAGSGHPVIRVRLSAIRYAAHETHLYEFTRPDGAPLPGAEPGAHIGLVLPNGMLRQYSLVYADPAPRNYVVGIKKDANSRGGSRYIHESLRVGTLLDIEVPRNNFPLDTGAAHTILFAGGIGITPIWCMVQKLEALGRSYEIYFATRTRADAAFAEDLQKMKNAAERVHLHFDDEQSGRFMDIKPIVGKAPAGSHLYCCGPGPMMAAFEAATADRPRECVHVEYFSAKEEAAKGGGYIVQLARSGKEFQIPPGKSILEVLRDGGVFVSSSCEEGVCGACETVVISGEPDHRDAILSDEEKKASKTMMTCVSGSKSARLVLDL